MKILNKDTQIIATPKLGIIKGIIIILLGIIWLNNYSLGALIGYQNTDSKGTLLSGIICGWVILGICLWRGILAIYKHKSKGVTYLNFGSWIVFFGASLAFVLWITH